MATIADRLKELRKERKISQGQLAAALKVANATIAKIETGDRKPSFELLLALAKFFNCSTDFLVGLTDT